MKYGVMLLPIPQNSAGEEPISAEGIEIAVITSSKIQEEKKREVLAFELFTKKESLVFNNLAKPFTYKGIAKIRIKKAIAIILFASFV